MRQWRVVVKSTTESRPLGSNSDSLCSKHYLNLLIVHSFIYFWLHWVFVTASGLSPVVATRTYSWLWCVVFSLQ